MCTRIDVVRKCDDLPGMVIWLDRCGDNVLLVVRQEIDSDAEAIASVHLSRDETRDVLEALHTFR